MSTYTCSITAGIIITLAILIPKEIRLSRKLKKLLKLLEDSEGLTKK